MYGFVNELAELIEYWCGCISVIMNNAMNL